MIGRVAGRTTTQGEVLADLFMSESWSVRETSRWTNRPLRLIDTVSCIVRWRNKVDLIVLSVFSGSSFVMADVSSFVARICGLPTIMWLHGGNLPDFERRHPSWVRRVLGRSRLLVAPSLYLATEVAEARDRVEVIPNVVDLSAWTPRTRIAAEPRLLWMRTFHPLYNPLLALDVFEQVRRRWPSATLTMAGQDKGLLAATRQAVADRGLEDVVRFAGFLGPENKCREFDGHDIFLNTNHVDNAPVSILEAAAAGLPVVATNVGGIPYLLEDGRTAMLVPDGDVEGMSAAVERILGDSATCRMLSENGQGLATRSGWPAVRARWEDVFDRVLRP